MKSRFLKASTGIVALGLMTRVILGDESSGHTNQSDMAGDSENHASHSGSSMHGSLGEYSMHREASGTSWQPDDTPMGGLHYMPGDWMVMVHGSVSVVYDRQGGKRGDDAFYSPNMLMLMASRPVGPGTLGFRAMLSLEPATISHSGYPELLQTGETADGKTPLLDRQHPHDFFMELAATYSVPIGEQSSVFGYFGLPGEPALGPPTFMHRFSGMDNPEAPITHHWLDSTHVSFGVATIGVVWKQFKLDGSVFTGREPNQYRWDIERPRFDSEAVRLSFNPTKAWAFQVSYGSLHSTEQLQPGVDTERWTASVMYHHGWEQAEWQTIFAWGQNRHHPGKTLDAFLLESALVFQQTHTLFGRAERVEKDELFPPGDAQEGESFTVNKLSLGYIYDFSKLHQVAFGLGAMGSAHFLPSSLRAAYGDTPLSFSIFLRAKL